MFVELSQWLQEYIASHKESFLGILREEAVYLPDGTLAEKQIEETARSHAKMLRDCFSSEERQELQGHLLDCFAIQDWSAVAVWLCMHFSVLFQQAPLLFLRYTVDEQVFQCYANALINQIV